jgi:ribonuclease VapC
VSCVLDASAFLAYLQGEDGAAEVADAVASSAAISAVNWTETLTKIADAGDDPRALAADLQEQGLLHGLVEVVPLTAEDGPAIAELSPPTRDRGLSLGDRACLALARRLGLPVLTADRAWLDLDVGAEVRPIRD